MVNLSALSDSYSCLVLSVRKPLFLTKLNIEQIISFEHRAIVQKTTADIARAHP